MVQFVSSASEGALMRRHAGGRRCGARADASHAPTREASGNRSGGITTALQGARWTGTAPEKGPSAAGKSGVEPLPAKPEARIQGGNQETRIRGQKSRRGAPRGARASSRSAARRKGSVRRLALHPLVLEGTTGKDSVPGAARNTGDVARPFENRNGRM